MIEHIDRSPRVRDRAIFVGNPDDIVARPVRCRAAGHPRLDRGALLVLRLHHRIRRRSPEKDRLELRERLGYHADERVCVVTVGGSGVGSALLRRVIEAFPIAAKAVPELRMVVVTGPRIDRGRLPNASPGSRSGRYVPSLYQHLAACDVAVVQGGLTTTMELTANQRPFLYFPLRNHFEQVHHVRHRLDRYGAGRWMDYTTTTPSRSPSAIREEIGRPIGYQPVETDGASRAASRIASLI